MRGNGWCWTGRSWASGSGSGAGQRLGLGLKDGVGLSQVRGGSGMEEWLTGWAGAQMRRATSQDTVPARSAHGPSPSLPLDPHCLQRTESNYHANRNQMVQTVGNINHHGRSQKLQEEHTDYTILQLQMFQDVSSLNDLVNTTCWS